MRSHAVIGWLGMQFFIFAPTPAGAQVFPSTIPLEEVVP